MSEESKSNTTDAPAPIGEIEHGPSKLDLFMEKNLKKLILLALLIVVAVAAFVIIRQLGEAKDREAGNAFMAAEDPEGYRKVISDFPDSTAASSAELLLAGQLYDEGKEEEAMKTLASLSGKDAGQASLQAKFALAGMQLKSGKTEEAKSSLESLLSNSEAKYLHPITLITLGDIAKAAGEDEKAREYYERKIDDYGKYGIQNLAVTRLNLVGVDEALKVPPPPAPEPTNTPNSGISPAFTTPVPAPNNGASSGVLDLPPIEINPAELTPPMESTEGVVEEVITEEAAPPSEAEAQPEASQPEEPETPSPTVGETPTFEEISEEQ